MFPRVSLAAAHERLAALRLLFPHVVDPPHSSENGAGLLVSRDANGVLDGAILVQVIPGALGVASPPRSGSIRSAEALAAAACAWLRFRGVKVCQVFAPADDVPLMAPLERLGFWRLTQLVSMQCALPAGLTHGSSLTFASETPPFTPSFRETLLATYEDSRDCPELNGTRNPDELLASFLEAPLSGVNYLALQQDVPVGAVMLTTGPRNCTVELSYLGVVNSARRRGIGRELVAFALAETQRLGGDALTVAVDARNEPALRLYRQFHFLDIDRREVWVAQFSS